MAETSLIFQLNSNIQYLETLIECQKNQPYFYFKVKLILNRNNSFVLADKVLGISKNNIYIFWTEDEQEGKYQALNTARKDGVDFTLFQNPQQKLPISKFDHFTLIPNTDPQFIPYLKSIVPSFSTEQHQNVCKSYSILFLKSLQDYETHNILCPSYTQGMQLLYCLEMMKSLKEYEQLMQKGGIDHRKTFLLQKTNLKLMKMICNLKFGYLDANTDNFGCNYQTEYGEGDERREMNIYEQGCQKILKNMSNHQFTNRYCARLHFKVIDEGSKEYATNFILPLKGRIQRLALKRCELIEEMLESLLNNIQQQALKENRYPSSMTVFPNLKYLNLSENKLTDNIFSVFQRLIYPDSQKDKKTSKASLVPSNSSNSSIQPLFPCLTILDLSKNYISLQSFQTHKTLVRVLENLSGFVLKISLAHNMIKSLEFFEKYFIKSDVKAGSINLNLPVQYIDLKNNASLQQFKKQAFMNGYMERIAELEEKCITDFGFIVDLGTIMSTGNPNVFKYLGRLRKYLVEEEIKQEFEDRDDFYKHFSSLAEEVQPKIQMFDNVINPHEMTFSFSKAQNQLKPITQTLNQSSPQKQPQQQQQSLPPTEPLLHRTSTQSREQLLTQFAKLFYLRDYKQIEIIKKQLQENHQVSEETLLGTFAKEYEQKRIEEKRFLQLFDQVMNFFDGKRNGVKNLTQEKLINEKLDRLVGIIRRKGLEGQAASAIVYMKHQRDQMIQQYLKSEEGFNRINPIYESLKRIKNNYHRVYSLAVQEGEIFTDVDYKELSLTSAAVLEKKFFENKESPKMDEALYDRLRYLLVERKLNEGEIVNGAETLVKELKLFPTRAVRLYEKEFNPNLHLNTKRKFKPLLKAKQKLTSTKFPSSLPLSKTQYLRQYSISHYPFNPKIRAQTQLSAYPQPLTCMSFPENFFQQALQFIQIVNNFITFIYYTPDTVSEQTVTYINYIVNYLNNLELEKFEDLEWKEFLIEEMYVHLMAFRPEQKLAKGLMLHVMEYLTGRIICRGQLQKYILAFLLENQTANLENSSLILSSLNHSSTAQTPSSVLLQRQAKISWMIPNQFLQNSFLNQDKLIIHIKIDTSSLIGNSHEEEIEVSCHETVTIGQLVSYILDQNNGFVDRLPLERKLKGVLQSSESDELEKYWLFEKKTKSNKLHYFRPYESHRYVGQIISQNFQNQQKITFHLRKSVMSQHYHNKNYLSYELNETQLFSLFNKLVSNIQMSIDLVSKLPQEMTYFCYYSLPFYGSESYTPADFVNILFSHIVCVYFTHEVTKIIVPNSSNSQQNEEELQQEKQNLLHEIVDAVLMAKQVEGRDRFIVNCKTFSIEEKLEISSKAKKIFKHNVDSKTTFSDQILTFIHCLGDLAFYQTLIHNQQIIMVNSRYLIVGKLLQHTNQLNQIVNVYSKLQYFIPLNQMTDLRLESAEDSKHNLLTLCIEKINFDDMNKKIQQLAYKIQGDSYFLVCLYNLIVSVCKNILSFDTKLLYEIQQSGLGTGTKKRNSKALEFYNNEHLKHIKALYTIPQQLVSFEIIRNKENQNYEKLSHTHSKQTLQKVQSLPIIDEIPQKVINSNEVREQQNNQIQQKIEQTNEVYSRKSSKRSIKSNPSQKSLRRSTSRNDTLQNNNRNQDSQSLIPSRKSVYNEGPDEKNQPSFQKPIVSPVNQQIDTLEIINQVNQPSEKLQENVSKSEDVIKNPQQSQQVVTNQQRKSKRQIPKRRSSRQKDR